MQAAPWAEGGGFPLALGAPGDSSGPPGTRESVHLEGEAIRGAGLLLAIAEEVNLCLNLGSPQKQRLG